MKAIHNIALTMLLLTALYLICATPFGAYTGITFTINSIVVFLVFPALAYGYIKANPELMENNTLFK